MAHVGHEFTLRAIRRLRAFLSLVKLVPGKFQCLQHAVYVRAQSGNFVATLLGNTRREVAAGANGGDAFAQPDDTRLHQRFHE